MENIRQEPVYYDNRYILTHPDFNITGHELATKFIEIGSLSEKTQALKQRKIALIQGQTPNLEQELQKIGEQERLLLADLNTQRASLEKQNPQLTLKILCEINPVLNNNPKDITEAVKIILKNLFPDDPQSLKSD